jgi:hypothetical protein
MQTGFWQKYGPGEITRATGGSYDPTIEGVDFQDIYDRFKEEGWLNDSTVFLGSERWWQCGKFDWALKCKKPMVIFDGDPRNYAYFVKPLELIGKNAIFMRFSGRKDPPKSVPYFDSVERLKDISIVRGGVEELKVEVYYCRNFKIPEELDPTLPLDRLLMGEKPF